MDKTGRKSHDSPFLTPPTPEEVEEFGEFGVNGPSLHRLNFDVTGYRPSSNWNKECASILASVYVTSKQALETDETKVMNAIMRHIPALIQQYKKMHPSDDPDVRAKVEIANIQNTRRVRRRAVSPLISRSVYPSNTISASTLPINYRRALFIPFCSIPFVGCISK